MRPPIIPKVVPIHEHDSRQTKILKQCFNHLVEHREPKTGRIVISLFMCLPSRKEFPEYFDIIARPISMYEIRKRIESSYYSCEADCIADFKLMFSNCRFFNEKLSQIFQDAVNLEEMLLKKYEALLKQYQLPSSRQLNGNHNQVVNNHQNNHNHQNDHHQNNLHQNNHTPQQQQKQQQQQQQQSHTPLQPKKRLLTGYIIYAAEVRKEYVDNHPNQDFGFVSRLIGHDWKKLSLEARKAYDQRAAEHNRKFQEKILRDSMLAASAGQAEQPLLGPHSPALMTNGTSTPKMTMKLTKSKMAKLARKQARTSFTPHPDQSTLTKQTSQATRGSSGGTSTNHSTATVTTETATQTARIRFVKPPAKKHLFDFLKEEDPSSERTPDLSRWLGAGIGRHESVEAALWALRDFMLLDNATRRLNMQPYL